MSILGIQLTDTSLTLRIPHGVRTASIRETKIINNIGIFYMNSEQPLYVLIYNMWTSELTQYMVHVHPIQNKRKSNLEEIPILSSLGIMSSF